MNKEEPLLPLQELDLFYICASTLSGAVEAAKKYNCEEADRLWEEARCYINGVSEESREYLGNLAVAVIHYIEMKWDRISVGEFTYHNYFKKNISTLLPGWKIVNPPFKNYEHIPDFFIEKNGNICPVEIKKDIINESALRQIKRYMKFYKMPEGYVAAQKCKIDLPQNIIFVALPTINFERQTLMENILSDNMLSNKKS